MSPQNSLEMISRLSKRAIICFAACEEMSKGFIINQVRNYARGMAGVDGEADVASRGSSFLKSLRVGCSKAIFFFWRVMSPSSSASGRGGQPEM